MSYNKAKDILKKELEKTYKLTATVTGKSNAETEWGESSQEDIVIINNLKCILSVQGLQSNNQTESTNNIKYNLKLFYSSEYKIMQGYKVTITTANEDVKQEYEQWLGVSFKAGTPMLYPTHSEVLLEDWRYA